MSDITKLWEELPKGTKVTKEGPSVGGVIPLYHVQMPNGLSVRAEGVDTAIRDAHAAWSAAETKPGLLKRLFRTG